MSEFTDTLRQIKDFVQGTYASAAADFDKASYVKLVDFLKDEDPDTVKIAIDQLAEEARPVAIAPLYAVAYGHPIPWVRQQAKNGLDRLVAPEEVLPIVKDKGLDQAVAALIARYGHYKS